MYTQELLFFDDLPEGHQSYMRNTLQYTATRCNALRHTATRCNTLQHAATHCNILQHTATHCNTSHRYDTHTGIAFFRRPARREPVVCIGARKQYVAPPNCKTPGTRSNPQTFSKVSSIVLFTSKFSIELIFQNVCCFQPAETDFLVIQKGDKYYLRPINSIYCAGQCHPFLRVQHTHTHTYTHTCTHICTRTAHAHAHSDTSTKLQGRERMRGATS